MAPRRPTIALNTSRGTNDGADVSLIRADYWQAVLNAGGLPVLLPQVSDPALIEDALARVDGVVMIGGADISCERYGKPPLPSVDPIRPEREAADFGILEALLRSQKPVLAICLGCQELNVALGGTLYRDLGAEGPPSEIRHSAKSGPPAFHEVEVADGTGLARALGASGRLQVNSSHHQGIERLGRGLRPTARSADGLVEAIELEDRPFFIGVQWHPERMPEAAEQKRLFSALVSAAQTD